MHALRTMLRKRRLLRRYTITYFLVFAIPLALFSYAIYRKSVKTFSDQYLRIAQTASEGVCAELSRVQDAAVTTANTLGNNPYFSTGSIRDFAGSFIYIEQTMLNLNSLNKDFCQIGFYSAESNLVYTNSIYNLQFYFENIFCSAQLDCDTDFGALSQPEWVAMQNATLNGNDTSVSTLLVPVERGVRDGVRVTESFLIAHLDLPRIQQLLKPLTALPGTHAVVFYKREPILSDSLKILQAAAQADASQEQLVVDNSSYLLRWSRNDSNFSVLTLLPQKNVQTLAADILNSFLLSLCISACIGFLLIFFSVKKNYQPISRLLQKVSPLADELPRNTALLDEMDQTSCVLDDLIKRREKAEGERYRLQMTHVLLRLLENSSVYSKKPSFQRHLEELGVDFSAEAYCCVLFSHCTDPTQLTSNLTSPDILAEGTVFCAGDIDEHSVVALFCMQEPSAEVVCGVLEQLDELYRTAGVGTFVRSLDDVTTSYKQAYRALISAGEGTQIHVYDDLTMIPESDILVQFSKETELFASALTNRECSKMMLSLKRISDLLELVPAKNSVQMLLHHILFVTIKALGAANIPFASTMQLFEDLSSCHTSASVGAWMRSFSSHLSALLSQNPPVCTAAPANSIKDIQYALLYINSHYTKDTFSLKQLADEMGMSISNLSHFFKSRVNRNISEYVTELRINEAKRLLRETDLKISEIVPLLGYTHASSFTKSFKQSTGLTPSQYKATLSGTQSEEQES